MDNKKSILICSHAMEIGGAERSLLDLLYTFDYEKYDVDLFLYRHSGEWLKDIPKKVNLLPESAKYSSLLVPMTELIGNKQFGLLVGRFAGRSLAKIYSKSQSFTRSAVGIEYSHKYTKSLLPKINPGKKYDLAISFLTPHYFVTEKVNADKKIAWIHTDYSTVEVNIESELKMWSRYDNIVSISSDCTKSFLKKFPSLSGKIIEIENILSAELIKYKSSKFISDEINGEGFNLLSIGRFSDAKNFDNVPEICKKIIEKGLNVKWYLIGYGGDEQLIKDKIDEFDMQNNVIILGKKENPYPYIKACDAYIQPSRYEGKSVAVREAQILEKPVIITNYATAQSQLKDGYDGVIVPMDNDGCADGIYNVLTDKKLMQQLSFNCSQNDYTNSSEVEKIYELID